MVEWTKTQNEDRQLSPNTRGGAMARVTEHLAAWANIDTRVLRVNSGCNNAYVLSPLRVSCAQSCSLALTVKLQRTGGSLFYNNRERLLYNSNSYCCRSSFCVFVHSTTAC